MKLIRYGLLFFNFIVVSCYSNAMYPIIPQPVSLQPQEGIFKIHPAVVIVTDKSTYSLASTLNTMISSATVFELKIVSDTNQKRDLIQLRLDPSLKSALGSEGYHLNVTPQQIEVQAAEKPGLYYGLVTLKQLLPPQIYSPSKVTGVAWNMPCVKIEDYPRFRWRGMHLDVGRHFMPTEFIKKYIDLIAQHKMNTFHWHLTEDQGWRIEIKKYPKLTEVGAWRKETMVGHDSEKFDGTPHGGFYTQDEIRQIVAYAKERYVTIVPEIEMPGHCKAALASYPELSCTGGPFEVRTTWGVEENVYCAGNDHTFEFLQNVLTEVLELFPGQYIHIGGDECPKKRWKQCTKCQARIKAQGLKDEHELQSWFVKQIDHFLTEKGRRLIGWDEILEGGLAPGAAVMSWRGMEGGIAAAKAGHDVVMAPDAYTYLNYYQAEPNSEPMAIGSYLPMEKVYGYEPVPDVLSREEANHILGAQAQIWTEYIATPELAEYMALPRMCALAETNWVPAKKKNYDDFKQRLRSHVKRLEILNVNFCPVSKAK